MLWICQVYDVLKHVAGMSNDELAATFEDWNAGELQVCSITIFLAC